MARWAWAPGPCESRVSQSSCAEMGDQIALNGGQVVEHCLAGGHRVAGLDGADHALVLAELGAMYRLTLSGAPWRLIEDAPVARQFEEQVTTALERLDEHCVLAQAYQRQVETHIRLVEGVDVGVA